MRLSEDAWIYSGGLSAEWRWVFRRRAEDALKRLRAVAGAVRNRPGVDGIEYFLRHRSPWRERLACDPAFDYWLFLWDKHFSRPSPEENWRLQLGLFQGFAAALALKAGETRRFEAVLDPDSHLHIYGTPLYFQFPKDRKLASVSVRVKGGRVQAEGAVERRFPEIVPGVSAQHCGFLTVEAVTMHGLAQPGPRELARFAAVLKTALAQLQERAPDLHAEIADLVSVLIPLKNPRNYGSVSSSYVNLRGAICLSHAQSPLLQAETLIHEFCHQKMNQLLLADPILLPGQGGQVFFSPWRPDARRLRGLILGAHAFLNVADYLIKSLSIEKRPLRERVEIMGNAARRLLEVKDALDTAGAYGAYTEFGRRFILGMRRELQTLFHAAQSFPPELVSEARDRCDAHRAKHCLPLTGIHRSEGFKPPPPAENYRRRT